MTPISAHCIPALAFVFVHRSMKASDSPSLKLWPAERRWSVHPATSLPEVAGKAAFCFDPHKPEEMAIQLGRAFSDDAVRTSLISDGRTNLLRFSWSETARQTLAVYNAALQLPLPRAAYA